MTIKKVYNPGDIVWLYGISKENNKLTKGIVSMVLTVPGYESQSHYLISVPSPIEPLLEVRTWETISQDSSGPVGGFRQMVPEVNADAVEKALLQVGLTTDPESTIASTEADNSKPKRKYYNRRKK